MIPHCTPSCLIAGAFLMTTLAHSNPPEIAARLIPENHVSEIMAGPGKPEDYQAWRRGMLRWREQEQAELARVREQLESDPYDLPELKWTQTNYVQPQMMAHDRYFYDPTERKYTVDRYLDDLEKRYGGIDSVLVWPTYPNIGVDDRNQYDLWRDMPGGIAGVKQMVADFHRRDVKVFLPIMIWDTGTRDEGRGMPEALAALAKELNADGLNGDTMTGVTRDFWDASLAVGHPLCMEPENGIKEPASLAWNTMTWGYWWPYQAIPAVSRFRYVEPRHMSHVCDRWAHNRTEMLQHAFFNGAGYQSWENVWGIWNGITPRDGEALRRIRMIYRAVGEHLGSPDYEPHTPVLQKGVYATKFPRPGSTLYTFVNRTTETLSGPQIRVQLQEGSRFYDLWNGVELKPGIEGTSATIAFEIEANGYGALLLMTSDPAPPVQALMQAMKERSSIKLSGLSHEWKVLKQTMVQIPATPPARETPPEMIRVPGGKYVFEVEGVMIEKSEGVDVQYPWEDKPDLKHRHEMTIKTFLIDRYPVTCAEFQRFLEATDYQPEDGHNFLRNWNGRKHPEGWEKKPVTWVSLEDARAYCAWSGKRLPHEWEWQYAAQGNDGRLYPWGNEKKLEYMPPFVDGRKQPPPADVDSHPEGASPFGVMDLVGNVWQWTSEFHDDHTRAAVLKGGSSYRPKESGWYFPQAHELNRHGKYLLMAPSIDRSASIGFRCVKDVE